MFSMNLIFIKNTLQTRPSLIFNIVLKLIKSMIKASYLKLSFNLSIIFIKSKNAKTRFKCAALGSSKKQPIPYDKCMG